jgi:glucose-6-phosphate isomerase
MSQFLEGAHNIDKHFFTAPLRDNIPIILGLLGVWNSTFLGYETRAILPYAQALKRLPAHIQQVDMESNGKRVALDGTPILHRTGEINFGEPGTSGQHSFYQLMHQGRVVPADFIGFMESQHSVEIDEMPVSNHDELMSNFFAQPDALAYGKTLNDLVQEGVKQELREHRVFPGNRPSSSILMTKLDAYAVGQLLAIYEHRTAVQGFIWGINSFDQWGVELGKTLAKQVRAQLSASRTLGASVQGFNYATSTFLEQYLAHGKK